MLHKFNLGTSIVSFKVKGTTTTALSLHQEKKGKKTTVLSYLVRSAFEVKGENKKFYYAIYL